MSFLKKFDRGKLATVMALSILGAICYLASAFDTFPGDEAAVREFQGFRSPWLDDAAIAATSLANNLAAVVSICGLSLALWIGQKKAHSVAVLLIFIPEAIGLGLKHLVDRARPDMSLLASPPETPAFPSGHAVHAILLFGLLIVIAGELIETPWLRKATQWTLVFMILACGASRVYLGIHWPSDVLGGYLLGLFSLAAILWARKKLIMRVLR